MATYPTNLIQVAPSKPIYRDGTIVDLAVSGRPRFRSYFSQTRLVLEVVHDTDDLTDWATLKAFYDANKTSTFDFTWSLDGQTYTCRFAEHPEVTPRGGGGATMKSVLVVV